MIAPEIPHSDNIFPRQMGVNLGLAGAHGGAPVLEYLDGGAVGDVFGDAPLGVRGSHDRGDGSRAAVEHVAPDFLNELSHPSFPLIGYGYCPNGTRACGILSTKIGAEIKQLACVSVGGAEFPGSENVGQCSYSVLVAGSSPSHFAFSPKTQNAKLAAPHSPNLGAASNLSRESGRAGW